MQPQLWALGPYSTSTAAPAAAACALAPLCCRPDNIAAAPAPAEAPTAPVAACPPLAAAATYSETKV